ncbi:MAG: DUF799 family lipoprotein [Muribaculaceae bacterium]|nr:DUF799 family lipoprotein [Muribaculaceae bacterium]
MKQLIISIVCALLLCSCSTSNTTTRSSLYPKIYEEHPTSILVMPPVNNTNHSEAKEYFYSSMTTPLCERGYYVISPFMAIDILRQESAYDSEMFINGSLDTFRKFFGVDAVLFTTINRWEKQSGLSYITVGIDYVLKSAKTGEVLFSRSGEVTVNFSSGNNNGLLGLALDMIATATADKIIVARRCNNYIFSDLPAGKYSPQYDKDQNTTAQKQNFKVTITK